MRRTKEEAEVTRQTLLTAALQVFTEKGYVATRLSDIADKANVTRGAIYWHFENKQKLFVELLKSRAEPILALVTSIFTSGLRPLEKFRRLLIDFPAKVKEDAPFRENHNLEYLKKGMLDNRDELEKYALELADKFDPLIKNVIEEGKHSGEISGDIVYEDIFRLLAIFIEGTSFILGRGGTETKIEQRLWARLPHVVDLYLSSLYR